MYNIYTYEKQIAEKNNEILNKEKEKKLEEDHKKITTLLSSKFKKRVEQFLYDMISKPVIIKNSSYDHLYKTESKNFIFNKFQTDKERISKYLKTNNFNSTQQIFNHNTNLKKNKSLNDTHSFNTTNTFDEYKPKKKKVYQPIMRFKPRNDAERILDKINLNGLNELSYESMYKKVNKLLPKNNSVPPPIINEKNKDFININQSIIKDKNFKKNKKYNIDNVKKSNSKIVKEATKDYHIKTFFNSVNQFSLNLPDYIERKKFGNFVHFNNLNKKLIKNNSTGKLINNLSNNKNKINVKEILNLSKNPFKNENKEEEIQKNNLKRKINYLFKLSNAEKFSGNVYNDPKNIELNLNLNKFDKDSEQLSSLTREYNNDNYYINEEDEIIQIDNKSYLKKDLKNISKHILKKCHFINKKFNDSKENYLEEGKGKLMITNGLSLKEFTKKYNLPFLTKIESNQLI